MTALSNPFAVHGEDKMIEREPDEPQQGDTDLQGGANMPAIDPFLGAEDGTIDDTGETVVSSLLQKYYDGKTRPDFARVS